MVGVQQIDRVVEVVEETLKGRDEQIIVVRKFKYGWCTADRQSGGGCGGNIER